jgi:hypothetical protein
MLSKVYRKLKKNKKNLKIECLHLDCRLHIHLRGHAITKWNGWQKTVRNKDEQTERKTNRKHKETKTGKIQRDKQTEKQTERETNRQRDKQTEKQTDRETKNSQKQRRTDRQTKNIKKQTDRETNRQRD